MASATVDSSADRLCLESIPTVDLRLLTQSELYALSLCSDSAFDSRRCDDVVIPKIDRSVFNESAGSRKQTYSRLRLAPRKPQTTTTIPHLRPPKSTPDSADENDPERAENSRIIDLLKELFTAETNGDELVPIRVEYNESVPESSNVNNSNVLKRKRGRPRKNEIAAAAMEVVVEARGGDNVGKDDIVVFKNADDRDREILNSNGDVVDVAALANMEDPYGPELKRRTEGMETEERLLGFLGGLSGQWASRRRKKKIVDASDFGNTLPKGWKLMLSVKKKEGRVWLFCRRYLSPNGQQFVSCKEVSSYLFSFSGIQDANWPNRAHSDENAMLTFKMAPAHASNVAVVGDNRSGDFASYLPSPIAYISHAHEKQPASNIGNPMEVQVDILKCDKCGVTFDMKDDLLHHQLSCQRRKRSKFGTSITDGVIIKDGKYECQFCHKTFIERRRYNGHVGNHVKSRLKNAEASSPGVLSMQNIVEPLGEVPPRDSMMQILIGDANDTVAAETLSIKVDDGHNSGSPHTKSKPDCNFEIYTNKLDHDIDLLSHDKHDTDANRNKNSVESRDIDHNTSDANRERVDEGTVVTDIGLCMASEASKEKNDTCEPPGETEVLEFAANRCYVDQERSLGICSPAPFVNNQTCIEIEANKISASIKEPTCEVGSESGLVTISCDGKTCDKNTMDDRCITSTTEEFILDREKFTNIERVSVFCGSCAEQDEDVVTEVKQLSSSDVFSHVQIRNEQRCNNRDSMDVVLTSIESESRQTRDQDAITSIEQERSSVVPNLEEPCAIEGIENEASTCMVEESDRQKDSENGLLCLSGNERTDGIENIDDKVFARKMEEPKFAEVQTLRNNKFAFGNIHDGLTVDVGKQEGFLELISLVPSGNQPTSGGQQDNVTRAYGSTEEVHRQGFGFQSGIHTHDYIGQSSDDAYTASKVPPTNSFQEPKLDEVASCRNTDLLLTFGNVRTGVGIEQICGGESNQSRVDNSIVVESHQKTRSGSGSLGPSCNGLEYSLNMGYNGGIWEGPRVDETGYSGNENLMIGFSGSNIQPNVDVMSGSIWRTNDANFLRSGLANNSHPQVQSSSCFPSFDINSDKGENEIFSDMSGFEGLRSGSVGHVEFNFLPTPNLNSLPESSNVLPYESEIGQGFDSSFWLEKDVMATNLNIGNQSTAICAWCNNEFYHEPVHTETQTGAIGSVCPTCSAKISLQFNVL